MKNILEKVISLALLSVAVALGVVVGLMIFTVIQGESPRQKENKQDTPSYEETQQDTGATDLVADNPVDTTTDEPEVTVSSGSKIETEHDNDRIWAKEFTPINEFYYSLDKKSKTVTITKYSGDRSKIMLSPVYTIGDVDYSLVAIGEGAFLGEIDVTSIYIPEGVTYISSSCLNSCTGLRYLYLPSTISTITSEFLDYFHEYEIYCDSRATLPASRDLNAYEEVSDNRSKAEKAGAKAGSAINGFLGGLLDEEIPTTIYFGGTESQWESIQR